MYRADPLRGSGAHAHTFYDGAVVFHPAIMLRVTIAAHDDRLLTDVVHRFQCKGWVGKDVRPSRVALQEQDGARTVLPKLRAPEEGGRPGPPVRRLEIRLGPEIGASS